MSPPPCKEYGSGERLSLICETNNALSLPPIKQEYAAVYKHSERDFRTLRENYIYHI